VRRDRQRGAFRALPGGRGEEVGEVRELKGAAGGGELRAEGRSSIVAPMERKKDGKARAIVIAVPNCS
jgi:hypothetical protein